MLNNHRRDSGAGGGPREPRAVCAPGEWALQGRLPALGCRVPTQRAADPSAWASASGLSSGTQGPQRRRDIGRPCDSCVCPERLHSALFPEFDLTISCLLSRSPRGSAWPVPLCTGWRGGAGGRGALLPLQASPLSHRTCHTSEGIRGASAPSAWWGRQPGWAWVGRASPPVFLPDVQCRGAPSAQCSPSLRLRPGPRGLKQGLGPSAGPCTGAPLFASWTPSLYPCLQGGGHFTSQPRECAHRKRSAGHSARRKSQLDVGFCSFTDFGHKLPIYSIFNQSKSSLFSHKLRKAEMLTVTVGIVRGLLLCRGDGGPAAALGGHHGEALWGLGQHLAETRCTSWEARPPLGARTFLGDMGTVFAANPLGLWPLLLCEQTPDQVAGGQHPRASLCREVVLILVDSDFQAPQLEPCLTLGAQKKASDWVRHAVPGQGLPFPAVCFCRRPVSIKQGQGMSLAVEWLGLHAPREGGSIPAWGTKISASQPQIKNDQKTGTRIRALRGCPRMNRAAQGGPARLLWKQRRLLSEPSASFLKSVVVSA